MMRGERGIKGAPKPAGVGRRGLLRGAGLAAATAAAGSALPPSDAGAFRATAQENAQRYQESEHVKTFYRVAGR